MDETRLSLSGRRWRERPFDPASIDDAARRLDVPPLVARCLLARAAAEPGEWLAPSLDHLHDPWTMKGMDAAVPRIRRAVAERERVRIVTDYDVDGTTSSLILQGVVRRLGGTVDWHIPDRFDEGYGFSVRAARRAVEDGVKLIVTADIGLRDHEAVTSAAEGGVDVIICDHHLPEGARVPERAAAVLCPPQEGCPYPNRALAACGVALKLATALLETDPKREAWVRSMLKVAAIGTVADVVDLATLENRAIVALGIDELRRGPHAPGLQALLEVAGLGGGALTARDLGWRLGPRINAAGRMAEAGAVVELFAERDPTRARERARQLDGWNRDRQAVQDRLVDACAGRVDSAFPVLWGPESAGWHRGVVGIVAARVRDRVHRPVAIVSVAGGRGRGSVRSVPAVHAVRALESAADLLERFGGHPVAAGFEVAADRLPALAERLDRHVREHAGADALIPVVDVDATCRPEDIDRGLIQALARLEPHGKGNPRPTLRLDGVRPTSIRVIGKGHLRFDVGRTSAVWWGAAARRDDLSGAVDLLATVSIDRWQGRESVQLTVEDARPSP